jgi:cell division septal protein FtsQ
MQGQNTPLPTKESNPVTGKNHQREVFRQITIPLVIVSLFCLALAVMVVVTNSMDQLSQWADISMIWLIIPSFLCSFLGMVLLASLVYLTIRSIHSLPVFSFRALKMLRNVQTSLLKFSNRLVEPFIKVESTKAKGRAIVHGLRISRHGASEAQPGDHLQL